MRELHKQLPGYVCQRHEDRFTSGWPDISVTGNGHTSYWEVKHATPDWKSNGIQELTMLRLAHASFCARYIFYYEKQDAKRTLIVHPDNLKSLDSDEETVGFDHKWLVAFIEKVHETPYHR